MSADKGNIQSLKKPPFVCSVGGVTFIIRYEATHELHILTCKDDKTLNWQEKHPVGTNP